MDFSKIAVSTLGPTLARRARWSWLGYGVAAYVCLRIARRYGWFGEYPDRILSKVDNSVRLIVHRRADQGAAVGAQI